MEGKPMLTTFRKSRQIVMLSGRVLKELVTVTSDDTTGQIMRVTTSATWFDAPDPGMTLREKIRNPELSYEVLDAVEINAENVRERFGWTTLDDALHYLTENGYR